MDASDTAREGTEPAALDTEVQDPTAAHEADEVKLQQQTDEVIERVEQS